MDAPAVTVPANVRGAIGVVRDKGLVQFVADDFLELIAHSNERRRPVGAG